MPLTLLLLDASGQGQLLAAHTELTACFGQQPAQFDSGLLPELSCFGAASVGQQIQHAAIGPATATLSMMPGYANAFSAGPTFLYPANPHWAAFFAACGPVHEMPDARSFETAAVFGGMSGASVFLMRHLAAWYEAEGLDPATARRLVAETLRGNAEVLLQSDEPLDAICKGVTTPGGITEQLLSDLGQDGALDSWHRAMTRVLHRMAPARKG